MISAGDLDRRVELQRRDTAIDATTRRATETFTTLGTVWAQVTPASGSRAVRGAGLEATADFDIVIRHRRDVDPTTRVIYEGRTYYVQRVEEIGRREGLRLIVSGRAELAVEDQAE